MTLEDAIKMMVELPAFKAEMKNNKKMQIYTKRMLQGEAKKTARELLLKYGFKENYEQPEKQPE